MYHHYAGATTRFLKKEERFIISEETEMPLVIEPTGPTDITFLKALLTSHSTQILEDISKYGAVLLRGFDITSEEEFENTLLAIQGFRPISDTFMPEAGRDHIGNLKYVLHTNSLFTTGGTIRFGNFHSENYYSPDVPSYICFGCLKPSKTGGETGLVNMQKIYEHFSEALQKKLEKNSFFVYKCLVSEVSKQHQISVEAVERLCHHFQLPIIGNGDDKYVLIYKPSVFLHPETKKKSLHINLSAIPALRLKIKKTFMQDYQGKTWFWHRCFWKSPQFIIQIFNFFYNFSLFFHSPTRAHNILVTKWKIYKSTHKKNHKKNKPPSFNDVRVDSCFNDSEINSLAKLIRNYYSSCLWKKGDVLLVDNRQVMHMGMPGSGKRIIRVVIANPIEMNYSFSEPGIIECKNKTTETVGFYMKTGRLP